MKKRKVNKKKKAGIMKADMPIRYPFYNIFGVNPQGGIYPLYTTVINGQLYAQYYTIPRGLSFGGLDIYALQGRDFVGTWNQTARILTLTAYF